MATLGTYSTHRASWRFSLTTLGSISNCGYAKLPTCDGSQMIRKIGYYAGWTANRTCNPVSVAQLDLTPFTHVMCVCYFLSLCLLSPRFV